MPEIRDENYSALSMEQTTQAHAWQGCVDLWGKWSKSGPLPSGLAGAGEAAYPSTDG